MNKKKHYLVINNNKNGLYSFNDQYQVFKSRELALNHFKEIGGDIAGFMGPPSDEIGMATIEKSGLIDLMFMPIEIQ